MSRRESCGMALPAAPIRQVFGLTARGSSLWHATQRKRARATDPRGAGQLQKKEERRTGTDWTYAAISQIQYYTTNH